MCPNQTSNAAADKNGNSLNQKQIQIIDLANVLDSNLRKNFLKKQQQIRRTTQKFEDSALSHSEVSTTISLKDTQVYTFHLKILLELT